jgi:hypothetical protein
MVSNALLFFRMRVEWVGAGMMAVEHADSSTGLAERGYPLQKQHCSNESLK